MVVSFDRLAELELNDAARYYELESRGLGVAFVTEVERCTEAIAQHPHAGPIALGTVRRRLVRRFPYALLYVVKPDTVRIVAVMNLRRRPAYWVRRV